jgi:hypothetical protein
MVSRRLFIYGHDLQKKGCVGARGERGRDNALLKHESDFINDEYFGG